MSFIILIFYFLFAIVLQYVIGNFPIAFFSFPLNLVFSIVWISSIVYLWIFHRKTKIVSYMLSLKATYSAIAVFWIFCLYLGLTGNNEFTQSWPFVAMMLYFLTVLVFVIFRGFGIPSAKGRFRWRFILLHSGLLLAMSAAFWGAPDTRDLRVVLTEGNLVHEAVDVSGNRFGLGEPLIMNELDIKSDDKGMPIDYSAEMSFGEDDFILEVNEPYEMSFAKELYLCSIDDVSGESAVLQIVYEPWKYAALAGIIMILAGALLLFINGPVES